MRHSLRACLREYCHICYALMPCSFLEFLRAQISSTTVVTTSKKETQQKNAIMSELMEDFLGEMTFNPWLLYGADSHEHDVEQWHKIDVNALLVKYKAPKVSCIYLLQY
jgi:hypothetical protein